MNKREARVCCSGIANRLRVAVWLGLALRAGAVMIRHDVPDAEYQSLAAQPDFAASRITLLTGETPTSATLISPRHLLTAGHLAAGWVPEGTNDAACVLDVQIGTNVYSAVHVYLFPSYDRVRNCGGFDAAVLRLSEAVTNPSPARLWVGGVQTGQTFIGIGQGRTGTGLDNDEPLPGGVFRGYQNTMDYFYGDPDFRHWRADFDNGDTNFNSLSFILYDTTNTAIQTSSSNIPLPLEGSTAAGDSGSAAYIQLRTGWMLAGIASYRWYSQYGGQAGYVNLSAPEIRGWLEEVAEAEGAAFDLVEEVRPLLVLDPDQNRLLLYGTPGRQYELQGAASLMDTSAWHVLTSCVATGIPCSIPIPAAETPALFLRVEEAAAP